MFKQGEANRDIAKSLNERAVEKFAKEAKLSFSDAADILAADIASDSPKLKIGYLIELKRSNRWHEVILNEEERSVYNIAKSSLSEDMKINREIYS